MVIITSKQTDAWSTGFNATLSINNNTTNNYGSNWSITCTLPLNSNITWCDSLKFTSINSKNQITLFPQIYTNNLSANYILNANYGGTGQMPTNFVFNSGTTPTPPQPRPPTPIPPTPIPPTPTPPTPTPPTPIPPTPIPPTPPTPIPTPGVNNQKRIVYIGYWLTDSVIQPMVTALKNANVTHLILTFITQPDYTKPLNASQSMLSAFQSLQSTNQSLLLNNFKVGISVGGALGMPVPFSLTFSQTKSYYYNNPSQYAIDIYNILKGSGLEKYIDLDIEGINDMFPQTATFIGEVCKKYKSLVPGCIIGSAPQLPYFCPQYGNVYNLIYQNYNQYIDYFFLQYYNNGPANTFQQLFIQSDSSVAPKTSVSELIASGIDPKFIIVGKTVSGESNTANGYVDLPTTMTGIIKQAFNTASLGIWCKTGGEGVWYYNSQNVMDMNNTALQSYFNSISKF